MKNDWKMQYHEAFKQFVKEMNHLQDEKNPQIKNILSEACVLLDISKMQAWLYETPAKEAEGKGDSIILYENASAQNAELRKQYRYTTGGGNPVRYDVYVQSGEEWDADREEEAALLVDTLFSYHGKIRTMRIAEQLTFWDTDFDMHNLRYFMRTLGEMIAKNTLEGYVACVYNLKRFSLVNDLVGRAAGTAIMIRYAKGLEGICGEDGLVCHLGGDNFLTLFRQDKLEQVKDYISGAVIPYGESGEENVRISAAAGFYVIHDMEEVRTPADVMEGAYTSAGIAKKSEETDIVFWNEEIRLKQFHKKQIEELFPAALEHEEFHVYYQPKISLEGTYVMEGAEALCRWIHKGNMLYPDTFIPVLEQSANICKLDFYMLEHVCRDIRKWLDEGEKVVTVSVNLSRKHLTDQNLLTHILEIIDRNQVPHEYIEIELTETTTDVDFKDLKRIASGLHAHGISISVDDFGMGYSSLNLIRDVSWNVLKIDKSFLPKIGDSTDDSAKKDIMLKYVIEMAQEMGLQCIVEGVETDEHIRLLKQNHCYLAQGYYFDKPLPVEVFEQRLRNQAGEYAAATAQS